MERKLNEKTRRSWAEAASEDTVTWRQRAYADFRSTVHAIIGNRAFRNKQCHTCSIASSGLDYIHVGQVVLD